MGIHVTSLVLTARILSVGIVSVGIVFNVPLISGSGPVVVENTSKRQPHNVGNQKTEREPLVSAIDRKHDKGTDSGSEHDEAEQKRKPELMHVKEDGSPELGHHDTDNKEDKLSNIVFVSIGLTGKVKVVRESDSSVHDGPY